VTPTGTEGYAKAEITVVGIDTDGLSSKTMEAKKVPGLYAIGEAVDVTGWAATISSGRGRADGWRARRCRERKLHAVQALTHAIVNFRFSRKMLWILSGWRLDCVGLFHFGKTACGRPRVRAMRWCSRRGS